MVSRVLDFVIYGAAIFVILVIISAATKAALLRKSPPPPIPVIRAVMAPVVLPTCKNCVKPKKQSAVVRVIKRKAFFPNLGRRLGRGKK